MQFINMFLCLCICKQQHRPRDAPSNNTEKEKKENLFLVTMKNRSYCKRKNINTKCLSLMLAMEFSLSFCLSPCFLLLAQRSSTKSHHNNASGKEASIKYARIAVLEKQQSFYRYTDSAESSVHRNPFSQKDRKPAKHKYSWVFTPPTRISMSNMPKLETSRNNLAMSSSRMGLCYNLCSV